MSSTHNRSLGKTKTLDIRGEKCPGPIIKIVRILGGMNKGESLVILLDSEECLKAVRDILEVFEPNKLEMEQANDYFVIHIEL